MKRAYINLTELQHTAVKREAARLGMSISELCRRRLLERLSLDQTAPWMRHAGMFASSQPHPHPRIDDVVYGNRI